MKKLETLVVEDEGLALRRIESMVAEHQRLHLIEDSAKSGAEALHKIKYYSPDLLLLDIELKDYNIFEILQQIQPISFKIIFTTAYSNYAVKAFDVEAIDYLLKPFTKDRFNQAIQKVLQRSESFNFVKLKTVLDQFSKSYTDKIIIPEGNTHHFIDRNTIDYIYSQGPYVNVVFCNQKKLIRISLKLLEEILPENFRRINKSTIVNVGKIDRVIKHKSSIHIIMKDQNEFLISDSYRENLKELF